MAKKLPFEIERAVLSELLEKYVSEHELSYRQLAEQINSAIDPNSRRKVSAVSVWSYATGKHVPTSVEVVKAIEAVIGVPVKRQADDKSKAVSNESQAMSQKSHESDSISVEMTNENRVRLNISAEVTWDLAIEIIEKIRLEKALKAN